MGKRGPPYQPPDDAQFIVVLKPPHVVQNDGHIDYTPLEYWLRAIFGDQRAAKFIFEIERRPDLAVIVELPSPEELSIPKAAYGLHSLRLGLKRRPWFTHDTGSTVILPYNFEKVGHPEDTRKMLPMISGACEDDWLKFDLAIPYPIPQRFDFSRIPQRVRMFCRPVPDVTPPPPDPMEIDRHPTPPGQERKRTQPENDQPLFYPEDDPKPKIKDLDPYQEEESISSFLRGSSSTSDASRSDVKTEPRLDSVAPGPASRTNHTGQNPLPSRVKDELGNPLTVKREFDNQDDTASRRMYELLDTVNRSHSPPQNDRLTVKRELENQDDASAREMYEVLNAVNRGQSTPGDGPDSSDRIKRDSEHEFVEPNNPSSPVPHQTGSWSQAPRRHLAPNSDRDRDNRNIHSSSSSSWRDRDRNERDRDPREWREDERGRELTAGGDSGGVGDRKRSLGYHDGREREDRGSHDRDHREYPDKRSRANYR